MVNDLATARHGVRPYSTFRRFVDAVLACAMLFLALPLMFAVGVAIRLESRGPIFEREQRVGRDERWFFCLKFRTAYNDHGRRPNSCAIGLTRVGAFIRYSRIEYLPELISVVRGELSLIEPSAQPRLLLD
jgi:O-antigen biosynthesis protein WbqP